jgi:hypothetical protein
MKALVEYLRADLERINEYLNSLSASDLDRELDEPEFQSLPTVGVRLVSILDDTLQHAGQSAYLQGLLKGKAGSRSKRGCWYRN